MTKRVLVVGDICIDVASGRVPLDPASLADRQDVVAQGDITVRLGGTAPHFADALLRKTDASPRIVGAVGSDTAGKLAKVLLRERGCELSCIAEIHHATTRLIMVLNNLDGTRLMVESRADANDLVSEQLFLQAVAEEAEVDLFWLSGYCLEQSGSPRLAGVRGAAEWCRERLVPIVVDLVPHDFRGRVGPLDAVTDRIGGINGVVTELKTLVGLGLAAPDGQLHKRAKAGMHNLHRKAEVAIVQFRQSDSTYAQLFGRAGSSVQYREYSLDQDELRGLGDRMAVDALVELDMLSAVKAPG